VTEEKKMKTVEITNAVSALSENRDNHVQSLVTETMVSYASELTYHEMADIPVARTNPLEQLRANVAQLEDINERMKFMTREIRYLMKV
jgi:hypothetical protein